MARRERFPPVRDRLHQEVGCRSRNLTIGARTTQLSAAREDATWLAEHDTDRAFEDHRILPEPVAQDAFPTSQHDDAHLLTASRTTSGRESIRHEHRAAINGMHVGTGDGRSAG